MRLLLLCVSLLAVVTACSTSSNQLQDRLQERLNRQAVREVGMPAIHNFFEKREYKTIYELRDRAVSTITYLKDRYGHLHKLCNSVGFGIPYATEYSAPQSVQWSNEGTYVLPQEDPNGLYSPASARGTWVLCLDPKTKKISPVYAESDVLVSQFPIQTR